MRQHEAIVQRRVPVDQSSRVRRLPEPRDERPQQQLLRQAHPRVRRHFERAELDQAQAARGLSGENSLSMQNSARCVLPVPSTSRLRNTRSTSHGGGVLPGIGLLERDLQFVASIAATFVDARRLARRADERAGEQVRQRRVIVPVSHQAPQQIGPTEERAVGRRRAAEDDVVAAAGAGVRAVEVELLGAQPRVAGVFVDAGGDRDQLVPISAGGTFTSMTPGSGVTLTWLMR